MEKLPQEQTQSQPNKSPQKIIGTLMLEAGVEFAFLIGGPLIAGIFAGKWLDNKYHKNFFVIIGILLGIGISCVAIYKRIKDYKQTLDSNSRSKQN